MQGANPRQTFLQSLRSQRTSNASVRCSYLQALRAETQAWQVRRQQQPQQQQGQQRQHTTRCGYLRTLQEQRQLQSASAGPEQIVVSHSTIRDAAVRHATVQATRRKRPRYDNKRRAAKAKARAAAHTQRITEQSRRSDPTRLRVLLQRVCECSQETCYRQFRDMEDVIAVVQEFASLPKAARDDLVCHKGATGFECVLAGRRMGPRCFARILRMHHGTVYKKGARVDMRLKEWMAPRRCPKARPRQAIQHAW